MSKILILGSGGHGKVVADILICQGMMIGGFLDDTPSLWGQQRLGLPILGSLQDFLDYEPTGLVMGIGSNAGRRAIVERLGARAQPLWINAIHPRATIAASARLGVGIVAVAGAIINADTTIGDHCIINTGATVDHDCDLAPFVHVAPGAHLAGGIAVGSGTLIGVGAAIHPSRSIGCWATIGAGSVVVRDVPDAAVAKGNPARW